VGGLRVRSRSGIGTCKFGLGEGDLGSSELWTLIATDSGIRIEQ
jgi:hypothetical protein